MSSASYCEECKHAITESDESGKCAIVCAKGHKPRFYIPTTNRQIRNGEYGWKRVCEDFEDGCDNGWED